MFVVTAAVATAAAAAAAAVADCCRRRLFFLAHVLARVCLPRPSIHLRRTASSAGHSRIGHLTPALDKIIFLVTKDR